MGFTDINVEAKEKYWFRAVLVPIMKGRIKMFAKLKLLTSGFKSQERSLVFTA